MTLPQSAHPTGHLPPQKGSCKQTLPASVALVRWFPLASHSMFCFGLNYGILKTLAGSAFILHRLNLIRPRLNWRKERDSNPQDLSAYRFSRPALSPIQPSFQKISRTHGSALTNISILHTGVFSSGGNSFSSIVHHPSGIKLRGHPRLKFAAKIW